MSKPVKIISQICQFIEPVNKVSHILIINASLICLKIFSELSNSEVQVIVSLLGNCTIVEGKK